MELVHVISLIEDFIQYGLHTGNIVRAGSVRAGSVRAGSVQGTLEVQTFFDPLVAPTMALSVGGAKLRKNSGLSHVCFLFLSIIYLFIYYNSRRYGVLGFRLRRCS
jgi:hypothetical protein